MFTAFSAIADLSAIFEALLSLDNLQTQKDERIFQVVLDPLFHDIQQIHENYLEVFKIMIALLDSEDIPVWEIRGWFDNESGKGRSLREKVKKINIELRKNNTHGMITNFVDALVSYFPDDEFSKLTSYFAFISYQLDKQLHETSPSQYSEARLDVTRRLNNLIHRIELAWERICIEYAKLKIDLFLS
jgi:hypothetical protein